MSDIHSQTPKEDAEKIETIRLHRKLGRFVSQSVLFLLGGLSRLKGLIIRKKSTTELRVKEKDRQAGIRRELRGLPTVHDSSKPIP